jgi:predicted protein tyrosine phosphatase
LHFHDAIEPVPGIVLPEREHVERILSFGALARGRRGSRTDGHLLVHCHMGISRSTAAMAMLLAQAYPNETAPNLFARLLEIRPKTWPNLRMIEFADGMLGRSGTLTAACAQVYAGHLSTRPQLAETMRGLNRAREVEAGLAVLNETSSRTSPSPGRWQWPRTGGAP